jgi:hypothetical protein
VLLKEQEHFDEMKMVAFSEFGEIETVIARDALIL